MYTYYLKKKIDQLDECLLLYRIVSSKFNTSFSLIIDNYYQQTVQRYFFLEYQVSIT